MRATHGVMAIGVNIVKTRRMPLRILALAFGATCGAFILPTSALADTLQAGPGDPVWMHIGANILLWAHILGGAVGIVTGAVTLASRKGQTVHRTIGWIFVWAMATAYATGAGVAPFLETGQRPNFVAGIMALYLLVSGVMAARLGEVKAGTPEVLGLLMALTLVVTGVIFMQMGAASPSGTVDGSPPQAFVLFIVAGTLAAAGELHVLVRRRLSRVSRIARHLWRMCFSLFIASGSCFLGQQQVFPPTIQESALLPILAFAPLPVMLFWLAKVRFDDWRRRSGAGRAVK